MATTTKQSSNHDPKLNMLAQLCAERLDKLLDNLEVDASISGNKYVGTCPIHGDSDNPASLNIYYDGYSVPGYWKCRTKSCQDKFGKNIIGFARGRLSSLHLGYHWMKKPRAIYDFPKTIDYLCKFLDTNLNDIKIDPKDQERRRFMIECATVDANLYTHQDSTIHRNRVRKNLIIPSQYFLERGYPQEILDAYDVGLAKVPKVDTRNRVIIPLYNEKEYLTGYTCRSIFEKCNGCKVFHEPGISCPKNHEERNLCSKWRHIGFNSESQLYNYWKASQHIKNTNTVILVEGPGDVWRLEQHGIHNSVSMFGHTLYDGQERLLANSQAMALVVLTDNDEAGQQGAREIKRKYGRLYRMYFPSFDAHDAGDMNEDAITKNIQPLIDAARGIYR